MFSKKVKEQQCLGIFSKTLDSAFVEAAGIAGLDFIILDQEHGAANLETLHNHVRAAQLTNCAPIIRVKGVDTHAIASALDTGAAGVQVPNINTAEQAKLAVKAARYYPTGERGVCRFVRAASFGTQDRNEFFQQENKKTLILQVEGLEGVRNLDEILNVEGIDVLFIGPYDLSQSVGKPGQIESEEVITLIKEITAKAKSKGIALGGFCDNATSLKLLKELDFKYISYSVDVNIFISGIKSVIYE